MKKLILQVILVFLLIIDFIELISRTINGAEAIEPRGMAGILPAILALIIMLMIYHGAGLFDSIIKFIKGRNN